ncbi:MAG TPA: zinc-ribbon domain-containing protein, partial [Sandaracinaceae bacterium LLY-WYZ-13_1]|nr:zinc-ribbon domain-containing protein [Sandaracinaceae bacterium LLY-WYZ-13_1]
MDVTCERCGTEYEFDETLVSDRGTTVKCTNCGHLFKVFRPDADGGPKTWTVRTRQGELRTLESLKQLQRMITDGALGEHDLISRGGEDWKRLGDIAELSTFFAAAAAATAETHVSPGAPGAGDERPRRGTKPGMAVADRREASGSRPAPQDTDVEPPARQPKSTILGVGAVPSSDRPPADAGPGETTRPPRRDGSPPRPDVPGPPRPPADATAP